MNEHQHETGKKTRGKWWRILLVVAILAAAFSFAAVSHPSVAHAQALTSNSGHVSMTTLKSTMLEVPNGCTQARLTPVFDPWTNLGPFHHYYLAINVSVNGPYSIWDLTNFG